MKKQLRGYFTYTQKEFDEIWADCIFVFDACSILDLYRMSNKTRVAYFKVLEKIKDRLWGPFNIAEEFVRNKDKVASDHISEFKDGLKGLLIKGNYEEELDELKKRISGSDEEFSKLKKNIKEKNQELEKIIEVIIENNFEGFSSKKIEDRILKIFDDKIGLKLEKTTISQYIKEGEERYKNKIPPGYKDVSYGDVINWFCIMEYAKKEEKKYYLYNK